MGAGTTILWSEAYSTPHLIWLAFVKMKIAQFVYLSRSSNVKCALFLYYNLPRLPEMWNSSLLQFPCPCEPSYTHTVHKVCAFTVFNRLLCLLSVYSYTGPLKETSHVEKSPEGSWRVTVPTIFMSRLKCKHIFLLDYLLGLHILTTFFFTRRGQWPAHSTKKEEKHIQCKYIADLNRSITLYSLTEQDLRWLCHCWLAPVLYAELHHVL